VVDCDESEVVEVSVLESELLDFADAALDCDESEAVEVSVVDCELLDGAELDVVGSAATGAATCWDGSAWGAAAEEEVGAAAGAAAAGAAAEVGAAAGAGLMVELGAATTGAGAGAGAAITGAGATITGAGAIMGVGKIIGKETLAAAATPTQPPVFEFPQPACPICATARLEAKVQITIRSKDFNMSISPLLNSIAVKRVTHASALYH